MSRLVSGGDDLDQNNEGSIESNDDYPITKIDDEKGKILSLDTV
jgi:hypothetical protein